MQEQSSQDLDPPDESTISVCTQSALKRWNAIEQLDTEEAASWQHTAADKLSRFRLWASNLGAYHDPTDKRSADYRVREAPDVQVRIVQLAQELSQYLDGILDILSGRREGAVEDVVSMQDADEDGDEDTETRSEISELWLMVDDAVDNLMRVSVFIRANANNNRNRFVRAALKSAKSDLALPDTSYDKAHVRQKHPKLEQMEWLVDRLGKANTQRRQFLVYAQAHQSRIAYDESGVFASKSIFSRPTQAVTQATTYVPLPKTVESSDQVDYYETAYAESTLSATTVGFYQDDDTLDVVPLRAVCKKGKAGICPYCQGVVMFTRFKAWRQHVFRDLMAYSCTFEHCDSGLFESRIAWKNHEIAEHRRDWRCPSCQHDFGTRDSVARHMSAEHSATEDGLVHALVTAASPQHTSAKLSECPFCGDQPENKLLHPGPAVSIDVYQRHLSRHMEQLALFAVPSADDDNDDDESDDGEQSSKASEHQVLKSVQEDEDEDEDDDEQSIDSALYKVAYEDDARRQPATPEDSSEPVVRFRPNGTAVYDLPPSLLNMPRPTINERLSTDATDRARETEDAAREFARETTRRQTAEAEARANLRRQEYLEAAERRQLDLEAMRERNRRPAFAEQSPYHGRTIVHEYHYPDSAPVVSSGDNNRRSSDSIHDRGRETIERERARLAAEDLRRADEVGTGTIADVSEGAGPPRWEPVFDEVEEKDSGREYYYISEGPARRRRGSWREEEKRVFWS